MTPDDLRQARKRLGLTQAQMAAVTGYSSYQKWSALETGARNPNGAVARLVQAYLDGYRPADWPNPGY